MTKSKNQVFLWFGENDFEIFQTKQKWLEVFEKKYSGLSIYSFDFKDPGSKKDLAVDLKNALQVNSLFSVNKLIILKNFLDPKKKLSQEIKELLLHSLENIKPGFFVIFYQDQNPDKRAAIYKKIKGLEKNKKAQVKEFKKIKNWELSKWIKKTAKKEKAELTDKAVEYLSAFLGNDLWQLDREIKKLANYRQQGKITEKDINPLVKGKYNDDIFQLTDAISARDKKKVLQLIKDQLNSGAGEMYLQAMLVRQFRIFWQILELKKSGIDQPDQMAVRLGLHPFVVKKSRQYVNNFDLPKIKKIYHQLQALEINMKTGNVDFELLLAVLVADL